MLHVLYAEMYVSLFFIFEREMVRAYYLDLIASSSCFWQQLNAADTAIHVSNVAYVLVPCLRLY